MWDLSVENIGLKMRAKPLRPADGFALPEKYGWRFYRPGDERVWGIPRARGGPSGLSKVLSL